MLPNQTIILSVSSKMFLEVKPSLKTYITVSTEDCWLIVRWKQHSLCLIYCKFLYGFLLCYTNRDQTVSEIVIMSNFHPVIKINVAVIHGDFEVVFASLFWATESSPTWHKLTTENFLCQTSTRPINNIVSPSHLSPAHQCVDACNVIPQENFHMCDLI